MILNGLVGLPQPGLQLGLSSPGGALRLDTGERGLIKLALA